MMCKVLYMLLVGLAIYVVCTVAMGKSSLKDYFKCPPCDESACPVPEGCTAVAKEPGVCGCCFTCARGPGEPCGVFTERCAPGLRCQPLRVDRRSATAWEALFKGKGMCVPSYGKCFSLINYN